MGTWFEQHCAVELAKLHTPNVGVVTPSDVLAYRGLWDPWVKGLAQAHLDCAADQLKRTDISTTDAKFNSDQLTQSSKNIMDRWNIDAGLTDTDILLRAAGILQDEQTAILLFGKTYLPTLLKFCPKANVPSFPIQSAQQSVIGAIEGQGILAKGVLHLLGIGVDGAVTTVGALIPGSGVTPTGDLAKFVNSIKLYGAIAIGVVALVYIGPVISPLIGGVIARSHER